MGDKTGISWTDATWNPTKGCEQVSPGCRNCYAKHQAARIVRMSKGKPSKYDGLVKLGPQGDPCWTGAGLFDADALALPLRWKAPRRIFVDSMSDLFFDAFTNEQIAAVFGVMAACPQHTFQVLTKRPKRMREWLGWARREFTDQQRGIAAAPNTTHALLDAAYEYLGKARKPELDAVWRSDAADADPWPLSNVGLGASVENQAAADERIPDLLATPAAVRFLSCEPLLGEVDLTRWTNPKCPRCAEVNNPPRHDATCENCGETWLPLDWVITGCESGPGARPCDVAWLRSLRDQCAVVEVPFFLKQATEDGSWVGDDEHERTVLAGAGSKRKAGGVIEQPYLDGVQHAAFPMHPASRHPSSV